MFPSIQSPCLKLIRILLHILIGYLTSMTINVRILIDTLYNLDYINRFSTWILHKPTLIQGLMIAAVCIVWTVYHRNFQEREVEWQETFEYQVFFNQKLPKTTLSQYHPSLLTWKTEQCYNHKAYYEDLSLDRIKY